jgi:hypothetical protein
LSPEAAIDIAGIRLAGAEQQALDDERGFVSFAPSLWIKVRVQDVAFVYSASCGHVYETREATLADIAEVLGAKHAGGCAICRRVRAVRDHVSIICDECAERLVSATPALTDVLPINRRSIYDRNDARLDV